MSENLQVALNYLFIITLFPVIFIIYQKHVLHREVACWRCCSKRKAGDKAIIVEDMRGSSMVGGTAHVPHEGTSNPLSEAGSYDPSALEEQLAEPGMDLPAHRAHRNVKQRMREAFVYPTKHYRQTALVAAVIMLFASFFAAHLRPSKKLPQLFDDDSLLQTFLELKNVNLTGTGHCDTCSAVTQAKFQCSSNTCEDGDTCRYGVW